MIQKDDEESEEGEDEDDKVQEVSVIIEKGVAPKKLIHQPKIETTFGRSQDDRKMRIAQQLKNQRRPITAKVEKELAESKAEERMKQESIAREKARIDRGEVLDLSRERGRGEATTLDYTRANLAQIAMLSGKQDDITKDKYDKAQEYVLDKMKPKEELIKPAKRKSKLPSFTSPSPFKEKIPSTTSSSTSDTTKVKSLTENATDSLFHHIPNVVSSAMSSVKNSIFGISGSSKNSSNGSSNNNGSSQKKKELNIFDTDSDSDFEDSNNNNNNNRKKYNNSKSVDYEDKDDFDWSFFGTSSTSTTKGKEAAKKEKTESPKQQQEEVEEEQEVEVRIELPHDPIDDEEVNKIGNDQHILTYPFDGKKSVTVYDRDLDRLNEDQFLNDTLLDVYPKIWADEYPLASTHTFSSFFYTKLAGDNTNYEKMSRWTANVNIFEKKLIIIPVAQHHHWYLVVVTNPGCCIRNPQAYNLKNAALIQEQYAEEADPFIIEQKPGRRRRNVPLGGLLNHRKWVSCIYLSAAVCMIIQLTYFTI